MSEPTRLMLDIETLGTDPGAAIVSIGAALFDGDGVSKTWSRSISLTSAQDAGLMIDAETVEWWLTQDEPVREVLTGGNDLARTLREFERWYRNHNVDEIWANSPAFDCAILEHAFETVGVTAPWEFYEQRDFRTLKNLPVAVDVEHDGTEHDAADDAVYQARYAAAVLGKLDTRVTQ